MFHFSLIVVCLSLFPIENARVSAQWSVVLPNAYLQDEAFRICLEDLNQEGKKHGLSFEPVPAGADRRANAILVGAPERNQAVATLLDRDGIQLKEISSSQGYEIKTLGSEGNCTVLVAGSSLLGDIFGLYWIWDRLRVYKEIPEINAVRAPALDIRHPPQAGGGPANSREGMRGALRYGLTWVSGENPLNLVPWDSEPEKSENEKSRARTQELIDYAHALHLKYFTYGDEFTVHPSLLENMGARVSVADPAFWDALQEKYRKLLRAMPSVDGVGIRTGELTQNWGNFNAVDVMHIEDGSGWPLEKRYRTFVQKIHEVVVGEFDKLYYHRTWVTSDSEQHTNPEVFKRIFTDAIPQTNLFLEPKITLTDRWYYQPFNPTFNLTPHNTIVEFEAMEYHTAGRGLFASFPGEYYQQGLASVLDTESCNVVGAGYNVPRWEHWGTAGVTAYTLYRLTWNPAEELRTIAQDFAAIHFGLAAAPRMAEIYLLSQTAYRDGIYIKPVAEELKWNTLPHLRVTTFPVQGIPEIDKGKQHIAWLNETMVQPCRGRGDETFEYLDRGLSAAERMLSIFEETRPKIEDLALADKVHEALLNTHLLVLTNCLYVKTAFAYFEYRQSVEGQQKKKLVELSDRLRNTKEKFDQTVNGQYKLYGIDRLLLCTNSLLEDRPGAIQAMRRAPAPDEIDDLIAAHQARYVQLLREHKKEAVRFLHWKGSIDGKDMLLARDRKLEVQHLQSSSIQYMNHEFLTSLPREPVTVVVKDLESRPRHPFVLEQPSSENGFTVKLYLEDMPGGPGRFEFDLYYIPRPPAELGL